MIRLQHRPSFLALALAVHSFLPCCTIAGQADGVSGMLHIEAPAARQPISINGILSEWENVEGISFASPPLPQDPARENIAFVKMLWDWDKLYVAFRVYDTHLLARHVDDRSELWADDAVEVYLSVAPDRAPVDYLGPREYQFWVNINGSGSSTRGFETARLDLDWQNKDTSWHCDFFSAVRLQGTLNNHHDIDTGYTVELGIPWVAMGYRPNSGDTLLVDFCIEDRDADEWRRWFDWCDLIETYAQPAGWARLVLDGMPAAQAPWHRMQDKRRIVISMAAVALALVLGFISVGAAAKKKRPPYKPALSIYPKTSHPRTLVEQALDIIQTEYDTELRTSDVAARLNISERQLQRLFLREKGKRFREYLTETRLAKAAELLKESTFNVTEICFRVGYEDFSNFTRAFKQVFKKTPSQYRSSMRFSRSEPTVRKTTDDPGKPQIY